jgi:hypothetical protein
LTVIFSNDFSSFRSFFFVSSTIALLLHLGILMVCIALLPAAAKVKTQPSKHPEGIAF